MLDNNYMINRRNILYFNLILVFLLVCYSPAVFVLYAHHDDYTFWQMVPGSWERHTFANYSLLIGRPVAGLILTWLNWGIDSFFDLAVYRLTNVVILALCCFIGMMFLNKLFKRQEHALLISLAVFTLPPFQSIVSIAAAGPCLLSVLWVSGACLLLDRIPDNKISFKDKSGRSFISSVILIILALMIHQSVAAFYWFLTMVIFLANFNGNKKRINIFIMAGVAAYFLYAGYILLARPFFFKENLGDYSPYQLSTDYADKLLWLLKEPLVNVFNFWNIFPSRLFALVIAGFLLFSFAIYLYKYFFKKKLMSGDQQANACGTTISSISPAGTSSLGEIPPRSTFISAPADVAFCWRGKKEILYQCIIAAGIFVLSFLPNLVSLKNAAFYRCLVSVGAIALILAVLCLRLWVDIIVPGKFRERVLTFLLIFLCLWGGYKAFSNIYFYRSVPSAAEYKYIKGAMHKADSNLYNRIYFIMPDSHLVKGRYDEFNVPSTSFASDIRHIVTCVLREMAQEKGLEIIFFDRHMYRDIPVRYVYKVREGEAFARAYFVDGGLAQEQAQFDSKTLVVDMNVFFAK